MITGIEQSRKKNEISIGKIRNYNEVIDHLSSLKSSEYSEQALVRMKELDKCFDNVTSKIDVILVGGTNGKSSTIHFAAKLLKEEGFKVGAAFSSHFLTYNERLIVDFQQVSNKSFTDIVNEVINVADMNNIKATAFEIMLISALRHFVAENVTVALLEVCYG